MSDELPNPNFDFRLAKQSPDNVEENDFDLDIGTVAAAGTRCVKKVRAIANTLTRICIRRQFE